MADQPLHEVFRERAKGVAHLMRHYVGSMRGFNLDEPMTVDLSSEDGKPKLTYWRSRGNHGSWKAFVQMAGITPAGVADVRFGDEHVLKSVSLGSNSEIVDNRTGSGEVSVMLRDLFSKTETEEETKGAGASLSVTVESKQSVEGVAEFGESVTAEAHAEWEETQGSESTSEAEGEENTTVPMGKRVRITETLSKADGEQDVKAKGKFTHQVRIGWYHGHCHYNKWTHHSTSWPTWEEFADVVHGDAPDNWPMAGAFKAKPPYHADLSALAEMEAEVEYTVKFQGRVIRSYTVEEF